jgi:hypothetical protein
MSPLPTPAFGEPSSTYDPTCIPQRYSPCPAQLLDVKIGAGRPGLSPNAVVVLVFFLTIGVWVGSYFLFTWWLGKDLEKVKQLIEDDQGRMRLMAAGLSKPSECEEGESGSGSGGGGGKNGTGKGNR